MNFLTEDNLRRFAASVEMIKTAGVSIKTVSSKAKLSIFLSHSHKNNTLAYGLIVYLGNLGFTVYVDWNDTGMPRITNAETANRIKQKIEDNRLFMVLATYNGLSSRWVPWEIGVADIKKGSENIIIIPVLDPTGTFRGNEYLQLYKHMSIGVKRLTKEQVIAVFKPGEETGEFAEQFFKGLTK